jgi:hypothetical protein
VGLIAAVSFMVALANAVTYRSELIVLNPGAMDEFFQATGLGADSKQLMT